MKNKSSIPWLNKPSTILGFIKKLINEIPELEEQVVVLKAGEWLFRQGDPLEDLYLILDGEVQLLRKHADGNEMILTQLMPGNLIGLISFTTGDPTLTSARIAKDGQALSMKPQQFEQYLNDHPRLKHPLQQLMLNNMIQRYQSNIRLHGETHVLNKELNKERNELKAAYRELEKTHQTLVHQEKMATLGELVSGFAHEVNNPASALMRSAENLVEIYNSFDESDHATRLFRLGLNCEPVDSVQLRDRMLKMEKRYPWIHSRSTIRKIAQMSDEALQVLDDNRKKGKMERLIDHFEAGKMIHNIQIASKRIANLVKSLKSYSRQDQVDMEFVDLRKGIKDTLLVLSNRLKFVDLKMNLEPIPETCVRVGDMNQVWTNIIINACDAISGKGQIAISTAFKNDLIQVQIADSGPGIPAAILPQIFEPNFTTKNQGAQFGLGLGLAISHEIIQHAGGQITAENRVEGGAVFTVTLPVNSDC